ncbi:MAG: hypothetical protein PHQ43_10670, partial [Dehalococcoidales bacterium]|nr:hypothetical protein [Dehalococcoidales bacterium]
MAEKTSYKIAQDRESYFTQLWDRMDKTRERLYMQTYTLKGQSGTFKDKEIPGVVSVTMNTAAVLAN